MMWSLIVKLVLNQLLYVCFSACKIMNRLMLCPISALQESSFLILLALLLLFVTSFFAQATL